MRLHPFEYRLRTKLEGLGQREVVVACSGGRDSIALLHACVAASRRLNIEISAAHVHHGPSGSPAISQYRDEASARVAKTAARLGVSLRLNPDPGSQKELRSEQDLRERRLAHLAAAAEGKIVALAHHADDLFETRVIRLIRGTGVRGLEAMRERRGRWWRPLLVEGSEEIERYANATKLEWLDDPTNVDEGPLRNWIRQSWLPQLEVKRPGASRALARSLASLTESLSELLPSEAPSSSIVTHAGVTHAGVERPRYDALSTIEQRRKIAEMLRSLNAQDVTTTRIQEVQKRLQSPRRQLRFSVGGFCWSASPDMIEITGRTTVETSGR